MKKVVGFVACTGVGNGLFGKNKPIMPCFCWLSPGGMAILYKKH